MGKATNQLVENIDPKLKQQKRKESMKKPNIESVKTAAIVTLVTAILIAVSAGIAFNKGISYERNKNETVKAEAKELSQIKAVQTAVTSKP